MTESITVGDVLTYGLVVLTVLATILLIMSMIGITVAIITDNTIHELTDTGGITPHSYIETLTDFFTYVLYGVMTSGAFVTFYILVKYIWNFEIISR